MIDVVRLEGVTGPGCLVVTAPAGVVHVDGKEVPCVELARRCVDAISQSTGLGVVVVPDLFKFTIVAAK